jgi:hypothetical protein
MTYSLRYGILIIVLVSCVYHDTEIVSDICSNSTPVFSITTTDATSCTSADGIIKISAIGGTGPYHYQLDNGTLQSDSLFSQVTMGTYEVTVSDASGCSTKQLATINSAESTLKVSFNATPDSGCPSPNGTLTVSVTGGSGPFMYKINSGSFQSLNTFTNIIHGNHSITVKDASDCPVQVVATVVRNGPTFQANVKNIIATKCAISGCHNGSRSPNLSSYTGIKGSASRISSQINSNSMPPGGSSGGSLTQSQIDVITCWIDDGAQEN